MIDDSEMLKVVTELSNVKRVVEDQYGTRNSDSAMLFSSPNSFVLEFYRLLRSEAADRAHCAHVAKVEACNRDNAKCNERITAALERIASAIEMMADKG